MLCRFFLLKKGFKKRIFLFLFIIVSVLGAVYTESYFSVSAAYADRRELMVSGEVVGVKIDMDGVMVLGVGSVACSGGSKEPSAGVFKAGDYLLYANDEKIENKEGLMKAVEESSGEEIAFGVLRGGKELNINVPPCLSAEGDYKLGIWVRDSTQGLGTLTFYDPESQRIGALGHGITDVDTGKLASVSGGEICRANIGAIVKGKKGTAGEMLGDIDFNDKLGTVEENVKAGVFGTAQSNKISGKMYPVGSKNEIRIGEAEILSGVSGEVREYSAVIEGFNPFSGDSSKCMVIKITDEELISKTGGIIQGMSGSPIIQDGKIIGAVTHVFLNNPQKGYGIFIENML
ncbi:MAG: SpoIVB peptidase [Clostridiales bacterium]|nr:SpoIVB peptidase [Clostridiales bacterium]